MADKIQLQNQKAIAEQELRYKKSTRGCTNVLGMFIKSEKVAKRSAEELPRDDEDFAELTAEELAEIDSNNEIATRIAKFSKNPVRNIVYSAADVDEANLKAFSDWLDKEDEELDDESDEEEEDEEEEESDEEAHKESEKEEDE
jgi:hypothetical protein